MRCRHCGATALRRDAAGFASCMACGRPLALCEGCGRLLPEGRSATDGPWCGPPCRRAALAKRRSLQLAREANQGTRAL